ncbi:MAG: hypothetical protein V4538_17500 [Bacteroidota bacterium]
MKKIIVLLLSLISFSTINKAQSLMEKWPELKAFHSVMSQTFHPSEEGNLQPIKERSAELLEKANALSKSTIPADYKNEKISNAVKRLAIGAEKLNTAIKDKKISDAEITQALTKLHDVFHEIIGLCKNEEKH